MLPDGTFDVELWEAQQHPRTATFRPNRAGYHDLMRLLRLYRQLLGVQLQVLDLADDLNYHQFEATVRHIQRTMRNEQ